MLCCSQLAASISQHRSPTPGSQHDLGCSVVMRWPCMASSARLQNSPPRAVWPSSDQEEQWPKAEPPGPHTGMLLAGAGDVVNGVSQKGSLLTPS